jgi:hypothetical protein
MECIIVDYQEALRNLKGLFWKATIPCKMEFKI